MAFVFGRILVLLPALVFLYLAGEAVLSPVLEEYRLYLFSDFFYHSLSSICHQYHTRCFWIFERPMGLCARCLAIYLSFGMATFLVPLTRIRGLLRVTPLLIAPILLDGGLQAVTAYESSNALRLATGLAFGPAGAIIYRAAVEAALNPFAYGVVGTGSFSKLFKAIATYPLILIVMLYSALAI